MIDTLFNIAAIIGFSVFCVFALIGIRVTALAWSYTAELAINEWRSRKIKQLDPEAAKRELDKLIKEIEEEERNQ